MTTCDQTHNLRYANLVTPKAEAKKEFCKQKLMLSSNFRCDLNCNYQRCDYGHPLVCHLSQMSTKLSSESCLLNKSSCLAPPLGITQFIIDGDMILVTAWYVLHKSDLDNQHTALQGGFVEHLSQT
jgi:hypothetical protein